MSAGQRPVATLCQPVGMSRPVPKRQSRRTCRAEERTWRAAGAYSQAGAGGEQHQGEQGRSRCHAGPAPRRRHLPSSSPSAREQRARRPTNSPDHTASPDGGSGPMNRPVGSPSLRCEQRPAGQPASTDHYRDQPSTAPWNCTVGNPSASNHRRAAETKAIPPDGLLLRRCQHARRPRGVGASPGAARHPVAVRGGGPRQTAHLSWIRAYGRTPTAITSTSSRTG